MKNKIEARLEGDVIEIRITANSNEKANQIFDLLETFGIELVRADLNREWEKEV